MKDEILKALDKLENTIDAMANDLSDIKHDLVYINELLKGGCNG